MRDTDKELEDLRKQLLLKYKLLYGDADHAYSLSSDHLFLVYISWIFDDLMENNTMIELIGDSIIYSNFKSEISKISDAKFSEKQIKSYIKKDLYRRFNCGPKHD